VYRTDLATYLSRSPGKLSFFCTKQPEIFSVVISHKNGSRAAKVGSENQFPDFGPYESKLVEAPTLKEMWCWMFLLV